MVVCSWKGFGKCLLHWPYASNQLLNAKTINHVVDTIMMNEGIFVLVWTVGVKIMIHLCWFIDFIAWCKKYQELHMGQHAVNMCNELPNYDTSTMSQITACHFCPNMYPIIYARSTTICPRVIASWFSCYLGLSHCQEHQDVGERW